MDGVWMDGLKVEKDYLKGREKERKFVEREFDRNIFYVY